MSDTLERRSERAITDARTPDELIACLRCGRQEPLHQRSKYWSKTSGQYAYKYRYFRALCRECNAVRAKEYRDTHRFCGGCRRYRDDRFFPPVKARGVRCNDCIENARSKELDSKEKTERRLAALEDLQYAQDVLGMSLHSAVEWIAKGYGVTTGAVDRWIRDRERTGR